MQAGAREAADGVVVETGAVQAQAPQARVGRQQRAQQVMRQGHLLESPKKYKRCEKLVSISAAAKRKRGGASEGREGTDEEVESGEEGERVGGAGAEAAAGGGGEEEGADVEAGEDGGDDGGGERGVHRRRRRARLDRIWRGHGGGGGWDCRQADCCVGVGGEEMRGVVGRWERER